jgi:hypothetical protein
MPSLNVTGQNGRVATLTDLKKLSTKAEVQAETQAALRNGKDDVLVTVGQDVYIAHGALGKGFKPVEATLEGQKAEIRGVQREKDEPSNPWRAFKNGMNFQSVQAAAGGGLVGMLGGAWVAGTFFGSAMPVMWGIAAALSVLGFVGASIAQGYSGDRLPMPDATKFVPEAVHKVTGH